MFVPAGSITWKENFIDCKVIFNVGVKVCLHLTFKFPLMYKIVTMATRKIGQRPYSDSHLYNFDQGTDIKIGLDIKFNEGISFGGNEE